jgi:hypothetical protein
MDTIGNFLSGGGGQAIGQLIGTGSQLYGQQNAGEAISKASTAGIGEARAGMGDVSGYWDAQRALGGNADTALSRSLGIGGAPADYSNFMNMPGYGFAVQQGTQAAERQAAAMGNAGNSGTAAMIGNQITGTAMQDYNNYIGQLMGAANLGSTANTAMTDARLRTAGNVEQLGTNAGMAQSGMYTGMGQSASGVFGVGPGGGPGGSGVSGSGVGGLIGTGLKYLGNWLNGSNGGNGGTIDTSDPYGGSNFTINNAPTWDSNWSGGNVGGDTSTGGGYASGDTYTPPSDAYGAYGTPQ